MSPRSGYTKNLAYFSQLVYTCQSFGPSYDPVPGLQVSDLQLYLHRAQNVMTAFNIAHNNYKKATNAREVDFKLLRTTATRIINLMSACGISRGHIAHARSLVNRIQHQHNKRRNTTPPAKNPPVKPRSVSQQSYTAQAENFHQLVLFITSIALYDPNETFLKPAALQALSSGFMQHNSEVMHAYILYQQAMFDRSTFFMHKKNGLLVLAARTKLYIRSTYGYTSPQFKLVSRLHFN